MMPLVTTGAMLSAAQQNGYAVAAFNCENMEMIQAVIAAAEKMNAPVILQTTPSTIRYASAAIFAATVAAAAHHAPVPVALHLDHGSSHDLAAEALAAGYTSVMIDGSALPFDENIAFTKRTVQICAKAGIPVEGELGRVGGKEDDHESDGCGYTDPDEAVRFVAETGVSSLAIGIGTAHGIYSEKPTLKPTLISVLKQKISVPMVLHGASGLGDVVVRDCIARGISKVNFATELRQTYTQAVRDYLKQDRECFDPKRFGQAARDAVQARVTTMIAVCGSAGKA